MSDKIVNKKQLEQLYRTDFTVEEDAEELLLKLGEDFISKVVEMGCEAAIAREGTSLDLEDIKLVLERYWDIRIPEFEREETYKPSRQSMSRSKREALVRKSQATRRTSS